MQEFINNYIRKNPKPQVAKSSKETPLMKQYNQIKAKYPDALLLFRVGDFYETFGSDAVKASKILDVYVHVRIFWEVVKRFEVLSVTVLVFTVFVFNCFLVF